MKWEKKSVLLTGPNTGVMVGTDVGVYAGQVELQVAPSGGFSATSISGTFYDGDGEVVNVGVSAEMRGVEALTFSGAAASILSVTILVAISEPPSPRTPIRPITPRSER